MHEPSTAEAAPRRRLTRWLPLLALALILAAWFALGFDEYLSFDRLQRHRAELKDFVERHSLLAPLAFVAAYAAVVACSLPGAAVMTIAGGFLFGAAFGTAYTVIAATIGASLLFLAARTALGDLLKAKAGPALAKMEAGFRANAFSYLLILRLVPLFPFFLVNLVPAFFGVRLRTFVAATSIGIVPATFVFSLCGAGLDSVFDAGSTLSLSGILTPEIVSALFGLAALALIPAIYHRFKDRRSGPIS
jgi:uncharacterized membrane protein YdjX (TVP38/TMEM64 family)